MIVDCHTNVTHYTYVRRVEKLFRLAYHLDNTIEELNKKRCVQMNRRNCQWQN